LPEQAPIPAERDAAGPAGALAMGGSAADAPRRQRRPWALALLLLPLATVVFPPLFNHVHPTLGGLPFFIWYQLAAVVVGGIVTGVVYLLRGTEREVEDA
jgi:hypothetical protein